MIALVNSFLLQVRIVPSAISWTIRNCSINRHGVGCSTVMMVVRYCRNTCHVWMMSMAIVMKAVGCWMLDLFAMVWSHNMLLMMMVVFVGLVLVVVLWYTEVLVKGFLLWTSQMQRSRMLRQILCVWLAMRLYYKVVIRRRVNTLLVVNFSIFTLVYR